MRVDVAASMFVAIVSSVLILFIDRDWLAAEWSANPARMASYTILALVLGASLHSLLIALFGKERQEEKAKRREEEREQEKRRAAAERKRAAKQAQAAATAERLRGHIESLDGEQVELLATAYKCGSLLQVVNEFALLRKERVNISHVTKSTSNVYLVSYPAQVPQPRTISGWPNSPGPFLFPKERTDA